MQIIPEENQNDEEKQNHPIQELPEQGKIT